MINLLVTDAWFWKVCGAVGLVTAVRVLALCDRLGFIPDDGDPPTTLSHNRGPGHSRLDWNHVRVGKRGAGRHHVDGVTRLALLVDVPGKFSEAVFGFSKRAV